MKNRRFTIVENAGYIGERDIRSFPTSSKAWEHIRRTYSAAERDDFHPDSLHIGVRQDWTDEDGTERGEYIS